MVTGMFRAGHLPVKLPDYNNRLRVLVATYVTFSPNGTELLVNMGGEQVCSVILPPILPYCSISSSQSCMPSSTVLRQMEVTASL
jgi:hypothetical protein